tara:strand:+ start:2602 stop:2826 length:225 start_codon:yes stop_codon:yes gene_type:complete
MNAEYTKCGPADLKVGMTVIVESLSYLGEHRVTKVWDWEEVDGEFVGHVTFAGWSLFCSEDAEFLISPKAPVAA